MLQEDEEMATPDRPLILTIPRQNVVWWRIIKMGVGWCRAYLRGSNFGGNVFVAKP